MTDSVMPEGNERLERSRRLVRLAMNSYPGPAWIGVSDPGKETSEEEWAVLVGMDATAKTEIVIATWRHEDESPKKKRIFIEDVAAARFIAKALNELTDRAPDLRQNT